MGNACSGKKNQMHSDQDALLAMRLQRQQLPQATVIEDGDDSEDELDNSAMVMDSRVNLDESAIDVTDPD